MSENLTTHKLQHKIKGRDREVALQKLILFERLGDIDMFQVIWRFMSFWTCDIATSRKLEITIKAFFFHIDNHMMNDLKKKMWQPSYKELFLHSFSIKIVVICHYF